MDEIKTISEAEFNDIIARTKFSKEGLLPDFDSLFY